MPWWTWVALGFFALMLVLVGVHALSAFRRLRALAATGERVTAALDELTARTEALERRVEKSEARRADVEEHLERLNRSLERLSVLGWALGDARRGLARIRAAATLGK
jgi:predicted nuclease with TOPRIM domain